jgi:HPt (histidine-containing phosphotransfer) domain-containing protein
LGPQPEQDEMSTQATEAAAALDMARLEEATGGDLDFMRELLELYLGDVENHVSALEGAVAARSLGDVKKHAHTIKGSSSNVGATAVQRVALLLERAAGAGDQATVDARIVELRPALALVTQAAQQLLAG